MGKSQSIRSRDTCLSAHFSLFPEAHACVFLHVHVER